MRRLALALVLLLPAVPVWGCLATEPASTLREGDGAIALRIVDWQGREEGSGTVPRRPRILLTAAGGWEDDVAESGALALLEGAADAALLDDLERAPLREEHAARAVACERVHDGDTIAIAPLAALDADASYTLVVGAWAGREGATGAFLPTAFALRTSGGPDAGAAVVGSWPADGAAGVASNLAEAVVYLDGEVEGAETGIWLEGPDGLAVPADARGDWCDVSVESRRATRCVSLSTKGGLAPSARYALHVGAGARDAHGAPIGPWRAEFLTAPGVDRAVPALASLPCDADETTLSWGCALVQDTRLTLRVRADEPVRFRLQANGAVVERSAPRGDARLAVVGLTADAPVALDLVAKDGAGNEARYHAELRTAPALATLSIVEVRANPRGPEPEQEFVELWNYGEAPVDLEGFSLSDRGDAAGDPFSAGTIVLPDARVLLVADGFDPRDTLDDAPPPGTTLLRVGRALAESGLSNAGEPLFLRDASGRRVSAAPAGPRPRSGVCSVRVADDMRDGEEGSFALAPDDACSPGR